MKLTFNRYSSLLFIVSLITFELRYYYAISPSGLVNMFVRMFTIIEYKRNIKSLSEYYKVIKKLFILAYRIFFLYFCDGVEEI